MSPDLVFLFTITPYESRLSMVVQINKTTKDLSG